MNDSSMNPTETHSEIAREAAEDPLQPCSQCGRLNSARNVRCRVCSAPFLIVTTEAREAALAEIVESSRWEAGETRTTEPGVDVQAAITRATATSEARVRELELKLVALGDLAVADWHFRIVGEVDDAVKEPTRYKDQLRALFIDIPAERDQLRRELAESKKEQDALRQGWSNETREKNAELAAAKAAIGDANARKMLLEQRCGDASITLEDGTMYYGSTSAILRFNEREDRIKALEAELAAAKEERDQFQARLTSELAVAIERDEARAEVASLREDKRRLDWVFDFLNRSECPPRRWDRALVDESAATQEDAPKLGILRNNGVRGPGHQEWYEPVVEIPQKPTQEDAR